MICEKCGSPTRMQVQVTVSAPGDFFHRLAKKVFQRKDVELLGANWETADFICTSPGCSHVRDGYGNYVTGLVKKVEALEAELALLRAIPEVQARAAVVPGLSADKQ